MVKMYMIKWEHTEGRRWHARPTAIAYHPSSVVDLPRQGARNWRG